MTDQNVTGTGNVPGKKNNTKLIAGIAGGVVVALGIIYFAVSSYVQGQAEDRLSTFLHDNKLDRHIRYKEVSASILGNVTLQNVRIDLDNGQSGTVDAVTLSNIDIEDRSGVLNSVDIDMQNVDLPFPPQNVRGPATLGLDALHGNITVEYEYDPGPGHMSSVVNVALADLGKVKVELRLNRFTLPSLINRIDFSDVRQSNQILQSLSKAELEYAGISLTDDGLEKRVLDYKSAEKGMAMPADDYRDTLLAKFKKELDRRPPANDLERKAAEVYEGFLSNGSGEVSVQYQPEYPISFNDIGGNMMMLMFGGFGGLGGIERQASQNGDALSDLMRKDVLKISYDD